MAKRARNPDVPEARPSLLRFELLAWCQLGMLTDCALQISEATRLAFKAEAAEKVLSALRNDSKHRAVHSLRISAVIHKVAFSCSCKQKQSTRREGLDGAHAWRLLLKQERVSR